METIITDKYDNLKLHIADSFDDDMELEIDISKGENFRSIWISKKDVYILINALSKTLIDNI